MRTFFLLFCLAMALCYSAISRAEVSSRTVRLEVDSVQLDELTGTFTIRGTLPDPCTNQPKLGISVSDISGVIGFTVAAQYKGTFCVQIIGRPFELKLTISELKKELMNLGFDTESSYLIALNDLTDLIEIDFSQISFFNRSEFSEIPSVYPAEDNGQTFLPVDEDAVFTKAGIVPVY